MNKNAIVIFGGIFFLMIVMCNIPNGKANNARTEKTNTRQKTKLERTTKKERNISREKQTTTKSTETVQEKVDKGINIDSLVNAVAATTAEKIKNEMPTLPCENSGSVQKEILANVYYVKEDFYTAFANQYSLMYKNFDYPIPIAINVQNKSYHWYNIIVEAKIDGFTDVSSITKLVNPNKQEIFGPNIIFPAESYNKMISPQKANMQINVYALSEGCKVPLLSETRAVTIHPPQINGSELVGVEKKEDWYSVFVNPSIDSITENIHKELSHILPGGNILGGYQKYSGKSVTQSTDIIVESIYNVLSQRNIVYVHNPNAGSLGQKIKYPSEVLRLRQANCIEGTILFASILESVGINAYIVFIPGHSLLGYKSTSDSKIDKIVETTSAWGNNPASFKDAISLGIEQYNKNLENIKIVDIESTRIKGILPNYIQ